jgi:hypothetical protein
MKRLKALWLTLRMPHSELDEVIYTLAEIAEFYKERKAYVAPEKPVYKTYHLVPHEEPPSSDDGQKKRPPHPS